MKKMAVVQPPSPPSKPVPRLRPVLPPSVGPRLNVSGIPVFPHCRYAVDVDWRDLEHHIAREIEAGLNIEPEFQRAHVWTEAQQRAFVEYNIRGGETGKTILFGTTNWHAFPVEGYTILDGKQRMEAARKFYRGDLRVFPDAERPEGYALQDIDGPFRFFQCTFRWQVVEVVDIQAAIRLYLDINTAGTPHTAEEIDRVRAMLASR